MECWGELLALGVDAVIFGVCVNWYNSSSLSLNALQRALRLGINPDVEKLSDEDKKYAVFQGVVKAIGKTVKSSHSDSVGVLLKKTITEHATARNCSGCWADRKNILHISHNLVPFVLKRDKLNVEIADPVSAELLDLDTIYSQFQSSPLSFLDRFLGFFNGVRQRGIETTEELLKEGTPLTAVGELSMSPNGNLQLSPPSSGCPYYLTTMPVPSILRRLDEERRNYKWMIIFFGTVGVALGAIAFRRWWLLRQTRLERAENKRLEEFKRERRRSVRENNNSLEIEVCVVCKDNPREVIVLPCGHVCLCEDCSQNIQGFCPVCRAPIQEVYAAFIA